MKTIAALLALTILALPAYAADIDAENESAHVNPPAGFADGGYYFSRQVDTDFAATDEAVRAALKDQGFGIVSEIFVSESLNDKLGENMPPYLILGACHPPSAFKAITSETWIGALLPCNVVIREDSDGNVFVGMMNPALMGQLIENDVLAELSLEITEKLLTALETL